MDHVDYSSCIGSPTSPNSLSPEIVPGIDDVRDPRSVDQGIAPRLDDYDIDR